MPVTLIDGIATRYDVIGSGPPLLMFSPGGFNATLEQWSSLGVYARTKPLEHLAKKYSCIVFDRRETGQSGGRIERVGWADYVAQGKGLLEHLGIAQAHLTLEFQQDGEAGTIRGDRRRLSRATPPSLPHPSWRRHRAARPRAFPCRAYRRRWR